MIAVTGTRIDLRIARPPADPAERRAIAELLAGIIGPGLARFTPDLWLPTFQSSFVAVIIVHVLVFVVLGFIEFPRVKTEEAAGPQRPLLQIITQPTYMVAASGGMIAFGVLLLRFAERVQGPRPIPLPLPRLRYPEAMLKYGTDKPDLIVAGSTYFTYYEESLQPQQRFTTAGTAEGGFDSYKYKSADVVYDANCAATRMYVLNSDYLYFRPAENRNFVQLDRKTAVNQDATVIPLYWMGNLTMSNASLQGVICA